MSIKHLKAHHIDVLKEIGNIGAGHAATSLSKFVNKQIHIEVPSVKFMEINEMMESLGGADTPMAACFLRIDEDLKGALFFLLPVHKANDLIQRLTSSSADLTQSTPDSIAVSAFQEVGNIVAGSYLSALGDFTGLHIHPSVPGVTVDMIGAILTAGLVELSEESDYAIVIDTVVYEASDELPVDGHFFVMPDPGSYESLFRSLGIQV
ncbi:chemotaxis protein CheY [Pontibacillus halophilus JSM 076056 = DSM 19796]|uniref:Chemotaxis protein CheY n=1 Tax=Pontibacillus halophilus JSM 076056 = DSM 19796 TaxID=1385510 RepID=A0A0A5GPR2_9BACI|nr:chemotaxis protein CheC [Pontibacillus halophilus]KGX93150.1 chemotaxis protein CheY [Pontibacillus halophilus JSM 076056 = DSM 19796]